MSCYIVAPRTLQTVVRVAAGHGRHSDLSRASRSAHIANRDLSSPEARRRFARALFDMNVEAFCDRYPPLEEHLKKNSKARTRYPEDIPRFRYTDVGSNCEYESLKELVVAYKSVSCFIYQCSEGDVPKQYLYSGVSELQDMLAHEIVGMLPEYKEALWG